MILVPLVIAGLLVALAAVRQRKAGDEPVMVPMTPLGRVALSSVLLMVAVAVADASPTVTVAAGAVMLGLSGWPGGAGETVAFCWYCRPSSASGPWRFHRLWSRR